MNRLHRLWLRLRLWVGRRRHRYDPTQEEPWRKHTYCEMLGHKWGGWRRIGSSHGLRLSIDGAVYVRRCRRRSRPASETTSDKRLASVGLGYKGGHPWRVK